MNKENWVIEYEKGITSECPFCGGEECQHSCRNCYSEMSKDECFKTKSSFCEKCDSYLENELPKIMELQKKNGVKCECTNRACAKCLLSHCQDDNCYFHPIQRKEDFKIRHNNRNT